MITGFRGNLRLNFYTTQGEVYPGGLMKKEYNLNINAMIVKIDVK